MSDKNTSKWTPEQQRAISERDCNLLVAAAAGAGKTAVLVQRILTKIMDEAHPIDIDRLLIVTFTNAAAAEMRERIGTAISTALETAPENRTLHRQLALLNKASITTIHSFCLEVIRNNFHRIDLDPGFRIADETEALLLKMEALEELFEAKYEEEPPKEIFLQLVECYGGSRDDKALSDMVLGIYEFVQSHPWPSIWLNAAAEAFNPAPGVDFAITPHGKVLINGIRMELEGLKDRMDKAVRIIQTAQGLDAYLPAFVNDTYNLQLLIKICNGKEQVWDSLHKELVQVEFEKLKACKNADKEKQEQVKAVRDDLKETLKQLKTDIVYANSSDIADEAKLLYPLLKCLCELVQDFEVRYQTKKKEKGIVDFNDLEHYCLRILLSEDEGGIKQPSEAALQLQEKYEEIFVDEYQDSNMVQEVLLNAISRNASNMPNLFMVGDVKQSIYRFRQAKPELFMEKYKSYSSEAVSKNRKIQLYKNFRSREEVINGVNFIFKQIMSDNIGELNYTDEEELKLGASFAVPEHQWAITGGAVELHIIEKDLSDSESILPTEDESNDEEASSEETSLEEASEEPPDAIRTEARVVVKRIQALLQPDSEGQLYKIFDKNINSYRPVRYNDIVILLRATKNWAETFAEELALQGIPAYADAGSGFFRTVEMTTILSLLQIIDNPIQDIPLISVLRSPIADFSTEELIDIRLCDRKVTFYEALKKAAAGSGQTAGKAAVFLEKLSNWRNKAQYMAVDELIWYLYDDTGYFSFVGIMPGGVQRQANLRILFERARQYEETSFKGLFNFIHFISKLKSSRGDLGSAKILGENDNVVRIMSIHKSKGLEFPVVFVSGTGKGFNMMDMNRSIILHQDLGFGPSFVDIKKRLSYSTVQKQALRYKIKLESLSEEMRILYVAFTRAKEKLIITGSVKDIERTADRWSSSLEEDGTKLQEYEVLKARSFLDWIGPAVLRHPNKALLNALNIDKLHDSPYLAGEKSAWEVTVWQKQNLLRTQADTSLPEQQSEMSPAIEPELSSELALSDEKLQKIIKERLEWQYPYKLAEKLPVKLTVTELKRRFIEEQEELAAMPVLMKRPKFMEAVRDLTAAEKGTIMHFVMQHLDLKKAESKAAIHAQINDMIASELLTEAEAITVNSDKIIRFLHSPLGQRLCNSDSLQRELPFNIYVKCTELYKELPEDVYSNEKILLQGVVDCCFEEDGELVLLDYKTDYVEEGGEGKIKEKYRIQLETYARVLEQITGKRVKEKAIYLFWNGAVLFY